MSEAKKPKNTAYFVNSIIAVAIMLLFGFIPPAAPLTVLGMRVLGIVIGVLYAWCTVELTWPSLLAFILIGFSGYAPLTAVLISGFGDFTVIFIIALFLFSGLFNYTGAASGLAKRIVSAKFAYGKPWLLTLLIMLATFIPAIIITGIPAMILIWEIIYAIADEVGIDRRAKWTKLMIFMSVITSNYGHEVLPFQISNAGVFAVLSALDPSFVLPYFPFAVTMLVNGLVGIIIFWLIMKFIIKPDVEKLKNYRGEKEIPPLTFEQKLAYWLFALLFALLMIPSIFKGTAFGAFVDQFGPPGAVAAVLLVSLLVRKNGKQVISIDECGKLGVPWGLVIFLACSIYLPSTFASDTTGINAYIAGIVTPLLQGMDPMVFAILMLFVAFILTNFINNAVVAAMMVPILYSFSDYLGYNMTLCIMMMFMCMVNLAYALPSASVNGALLHSQKDAISTKEILLNSLWSMPIIFIVGILAFFLSTLIV